MKEFCKLKDKSLMELGSISREGQTQRAKIEVTEVQVSLLVALLGSNKIHRQHCVYSNERKSHNERK